MKEFFDAADVFLAKNDPAILAVCAAIVLVLIFLERRKRKKERMQSFPCNACEYAGHCEEQCLD